MATTPTAKECAIDRTRSLANEPGVWSNLACDLGVPLAAGAMLGLPFYSERCSLVAWIALVPLAWVLSAPHATIALYGGSFYGGLVFALLGLDWMRESYNGKLIDSWIVIGHLLALFWVGAIWVGRRVMQATRLPAVIILPTFWVALESMRWGLAGIPVEDGFPLMQLGTTQIEHERLIQIADLGGVAAVSWLVALVNGALFDVLSAAPLFSCRRSQVKPVYSICLAILLVAAAMFYGQWRLQGPIGEAGPTVGIVSGRFDFTGEDAATTIRDEILSRLALDDVARLEPRFRPSYPELLIWKETAAPDFVSIETNTSSIGAPDLPGNHEPSDNDLNGAKGTLHRARTFARLAQCSLILGTKRTAHDSSRNSVVYLTHDSDRLEYYDKVHLAPWREFRPGIASWLGVLPTQDDAQKRHPPMHSGRRQRTFALTQGDKSHRFAATICYDLFFPAEHRRLVNADFSGTSLDFFIGATNENGASKSTFPRVSLAAQRFRAIECRRSYARNAEYGISAIVDSRGQRAPTLQIDSDTGRTILLGRVPVVHDRSAYVRFGEWLSAICCICCGGILLESICRPHLRRDSGHC